MDRVCPQSVMSLVFSLTNQKPYQILEALIRYALEVQEEFNRMPGEFWQFMNVNFARSYRKCLEFEIKMHGLILRTFTSSPWREQIG